MILKKKTNTNKYNIKKDNTYKNLRYYDKEIQLKNEYF